MSLKAKTVNGIFWATLQRFGIQVANLITQIILARMLMPSDFGLIAMIGIFMVISQTLIDSGMTSSLIREQQIEHKDYCTVFYINLCVSLLMYLILFITAPFIAIFFNEEILTSLIRVYTIIFIVQVFSSIQLTKLTKEMKFKSQLTLQLPATIIGGCCGIWMAYHNYGIWSLVGLNLITALSLAVIVWLKVDWRPTLAFDFLSLKKHFKFGYKLTLSSLVANVYSELYPLIIGRQFSSTELGYYKQAHTLRMFPVSNITSALAKVTYPLFSKVKDDNVKLKKIFKKITKLVFFFTTSIMLFCVSIAEPLFRLILTEKWLPAAPYFQILCLAAIFYPLSMYNLNIIIAKGLSGLHLKLEIFKKICSIFILLILLPFGIYGVVIASAIGMVFGALVNINYSGKLINYSIFSQLRDLSPILICGSVSMIFSSIYINHYSINTGDFLKLLIAGIIFYTSYIFMSYIFKLAVLHELSDLIKYVFRKKMS